MESRQGHKDSRCVFQRKTAGFILRVAARCPAPDFTDNTQAPVTDTTVSEPAQSDTFILRAASI